MSYKKQYDMQSTKELVDWTNYNVQKNYFVDKIKHIIFFILSYLLKPLNERKIISEK